jgi:hypothetical protein
MQMTVKQQLITEIERIDNPVTLVQIFEIMQLLTHTPQQPKNALISEFAGCLDDESARQMTTIIDNEFNAIEGEW